MRRIIFLSAAVMVAAGLTGCETASRHGTAPAGPAGFSAAPSQTGQTVQTEYVSPATSPAPSAVTPADFRSRLTTFDAGKDCKT